MEKPGGRIRTHSLNMGNIDLGEEKTSGDGISASSFFCPSLFSHSSFLRKDERNYSFLFVYRRHHEEFFEGALLYRHDHIKRGWEGRRKTEISMTEWWRNNAFVSRLDDFRIGNGPIRHDGNVTSFTFCSESIWLWLQCHEWCNGGIDTRSRNHRWTVESSVLWGEC